MDFSAWMQALADGLAVLLTQAVEYLPRVIMALVVVLIGWVVAWLLRALTVRLISGLDRLWHSLVARTGLKRLQPRHPPARIVGEFVFWLILLFFAATATEILGLGIFVTWLVEIASYLPVLLGGALIVLAGFIVSSLARDLIVAGAASAGIQQAELLGRLGQIVILVTAVLVGVDQIGLNISFLSVIAGVVLAATLGGAALAFGVGARIHVANLVAGQQLRQIYRVGDRLQVGERSGRISKITPTKVFLDGEQGQVSVPAKLFDEEVVVLVARGSDDESQ